MKTLDTLLTLQNIRRMAGTRFFERGQDYFEHGQVGRLAERNEVIKATVRGTRTYHVKLWVEENEMAYACTCPVGTDGMFCKHCVAVGLAWLQKGNVEKSSSAGSRKQGVTMDDVRAYLAREEQSVLVDLLVERAEEDDRLRERLFMKTAKKGAKGLNLVTFRRAIDRAVDGGGFVDYYSAYAYAQGIEDVVDSIADLLKEGHAEAVIELSEYALRAVEESLHSVDDSDGYMGGILDRLQDLHHQACRKSRPDPEALAERLFEWELRTEWDTFYGAAARYADVLGKKGLAVYRTLAEARWARVSQLKPGSPGRFADTPRFRLTHIMETLAKQSGDVEALVAVKSKDLSHAYSFLQIAELYKQARKPDLALEWAERGIRAFPEQTDSRLREFLAQEYHRRDRHDSAMALIWAEFADFPHLDRYKLLKTHADKTKQWPEWRDKALGLIREKISKAKQRGRTTQWHWGDPADHSELVRIFLWEKDVEAAWHEAREGGCSQDLWLQLAAKREHDHPEDAMVIYKNRIEPTLARKNNDAYQEAVTHLKKIHQLMTAVNRQEEFSDYILSLRLTHKPKRNFMKLLDKQKWA